MTEITGYHAHVYYDTQTKERARAVSEAARDLFDAEMGRMHDTPVGPHPMGSCQLAFGPETFAGLVPWLALNRDGLVVFLHPNTGDALTDHRDRAIWMGTGLTLKLDILT